MKIKDLIKQLQEFDPEMEVAKPEHDRSGNFGYDLFTYLEVVDVIEGYQGFNYKEPHRYAPAQKKILTIS